MSQVAYNERYSRLRKLLSASLNEVSTQANAGNLLEAALFADDVQFLAGRLARSLREEADFYASLNQQVAL